MAIDFTAFERGRMMGLENANRELLLRQRAEELRINQEAARYTAPLAVNKLRAIQAGIDPVDFSIAQQDRAINDPAFQSFSPELQNAILARLNQSNLITAQQLTNQGRLPEAQRLLDSTNAVQIAGDLGDPRAGQIRGVTNFEIAASAGDWQGAVDAFKQTYPNAPVEFRDGSIYIGGQPFEPSVAVQRLRPMDVSQAVEPSWVRAAREAQLQGLSQIGVTPTVPVGSVQAPVGAPAAPGSIPLMSAQNPQAGYFDATGLQPVGAPPVPTATAAQPAAPTQPTAPPAAGLPTLDEYRAADPVRKEQIKEQWRQASLVSPLENAWTQYMQTGLGATSRGLSQGLQAAPFGTNATDWTNPFLYTPGYVAGRGLNDLGRLYNQARTGVSDALYNVLTPSVEVDNQALRNLQEARAIDSGR